MGWRARQHPIGGSRAAPAAPVAGGGRAGGTEGGRAGGRPRVTGQLPSACRPQKAEALHNHLQNCHLREREPGMSRVKFPSFPFCSLET